MGENATEAENATIVRGLSDTPGSSTRRDVSNCVPLNERYIPAQCGPNSLCVDGSCYNSVRWSQSRFETHLVTTSRKESAASRHTTATLRQQLRASLTAMLLQCAEWTPCMETRNAH